MSGVEFARRSGVNRSTIHRIAAGQTDPTLGTLRELAIVHGLDLDVTLRRLSDPAAAVAARLLLDDTMLGHASDPSEQRWVRRLERLDRPADIVIAAGHASAPAERPGAVLLRGDRGALRLASAGASAGGRWAVSGWAGLGALEQSDPASGPSILWVDDPQRTARMLRDTHRLVSSPANAQVVVTAAADAVFVDAWQDGPVRYVAPVQIVLDCIGLGGELERLALDVAERWSQR